MKKCLFTFASIGLAIWAGQGMAKDIQHDAEHYMLLAQHGERWAQEDEEVTAKLAEVREATAANAPIFSLC